MRAAAGNLQLGEKRVLSFKRQGHRLKLKVLLVSAFLEPGALGDGLAQLLVQVGQLLPHDVNLVGVHLAERRRLLPLMLLMLLLLLLGVGLDELLELGLELLDVRPEAGLTVHQLRVLHGLLVVLRGQSLDLGRQLLAVARVLLNNLEEIT